MINRFIYIVNYPLTELNYEKSGIEFLLNKGYSVEVIDAFNIQYPNEYRNVLLPQVSSKEIKITEVSMYSDIKKILNSYSDSDCVILMYRTGFIFNRITRVLNKKKIPVVCISTGSIPSPNFDRKNNYLERIKKDLKVYSFKFILNFIFHKILDRVSFILLRPKVQYFIYGGTFSLINSAKILKQASKIVSAHTLDYDIFLQEKLKIKSEYEKSNKQKKYIVFVDQNLLDDPDRYLHNNSSPVIDYMRLEYYKKIGVFFDYLEGEFSHKVVIAAHPRSDVNLLSENFKNREVVINNTAKLIKNCEFCVLHSSTAVNFAVLYKKPVVIYKMKLFSHIMSKYQDMFSDAIANSINLSVVKIDSSNYKVSSPFIDKEAYLKYREMFIKENNSDNKMFWEILEESIDS